MVVAGPESQADERSRIRYGLRLPTVIGLEAAHGILAGLIPRSGWLSAQIMFADESFLNRLRSFGFNFLLAACSRLFLARTRVLRLAVVRGSGRARF